MLDIKWLRENKDEAQTRLQARDPRIDLTPLLAAEQENRELVTRIEQLRAEQNRLGKEIQQRKRNQEDADELMEQVSSIKAEVLSLNARQKEISERFETLALALPNLPDPSVPTSPNKEDAEVVREWGEFPEFSFSPQNHLELGVRHKLFDFERAAKITGAGFPMYTGVGARLERALINFLLDQNEESGYTPMVLPYLVNRDTGITSGQLPKFADQMYHVGEDDLYLIPTAEIALGGLYRGEILAADELPLRFCAYTACFRREAGTYGTEERGLVRTHQFNKIEIFSIVPPEESYPELERVRRQAECLVEKLGLHYRTTLLVANDMAQGAAKTYDIEIWLPGQNRYYEVSSCSNCEAYQARRGNIRYRPAPNEKPLFVHTLNGSALATSRLLIGILETNQQDDGSIVVPEVLRPYLNGLSKISHAE